MQVGQDCDAYSNIYIYYNIWLSTTLEVSGVWGYE